MGFFGNLTRSFKKSRRLRKLQSEIAPPQETIDDMVSDFWDSLRSGDSRKDQALEEFLDMCESDDSVAMVMKKYNMDRDDLKGIYSELLAAGLGQWIKGHYVALSTIAYYEPLYYYVESKRKGSSIYDIANGLIEYWTGSIRQGEFYRSVS
jgi:hypothetical protein